MTQEGPSCFGSLPCSTNTQDHYNLSCLLVYFIRCSSISNASNYFFHPTHFSVREMRPGSWPSPTGFRLWGSPIPYIFGGLAAMMGLIAIALIVLACTRRKSSDEDSTLPCSIERPGIIPLDMEPKIVVIMAGDYKPTFLAKPLSVHHHHHPAI